VKSATPGGTATSPSERMPPQQPCPCNNLVVPTAICPQTRFFYTQKAGKGFLPGNPPGSPLPVLPFSMSSVSLWLISLCASVLTV